MYRYFPSIKSFSKFPCVAKNKNVGLRSLNITFLYDAVLFFIHYIICKFVFVLTIIVCVNL